MEIITKLLKKIECTNIEKGAIEFDKFLRLGERQVIKRFLFIWNLIYREDLIGLGHGVLD